MALNKNGMDLKAIRRDQKAIDALPNHGRASLKPYAKKMKLDKPSKSRVYIAPPAPETAFKKRNASEQKAHEEYYKKNKGHYEMR